MLDDLRGFNESDTSKPYITGVFEVFSRDRFTVGDGKTYSYPPKKRRSVRSLDRYQNIMNVQLQPDTDYVVSFRAHEDEVEFLFYGETMKNNNKLILPQKFQSPLLKIHTFASLQIIQQNNTFVLFFPVFFFIFANISVANITRNSAQKHFLYELNTLLQNGPWCDGL